MLVGFQVCALPATFLHKVNTVALHLSNRKTNVITNKVFFALDSMCLFSVLRVLWDDS